MKKRNHSKTLLVLLYIPHLLPLACMSKDILEYIFRPKCIHRWQRPHNFHATFTLDLWNDHIIQPARDAVLDYYKVPLCPIFPHNARAKTYSTELYLFFSATQSHPTSKSTCASTIYPSSYLRSVVSICLTLYRLGSLYHTHIIIYSYFVNHKFMLVVSLAYDSRESSLTRYNLRSEDACWFTRLSKEMHIEERLHIRRCEDKMILY